MDRKDLKIQALLEKISSTESSNADLRVELTIQSQRADNLEKELANLHEEINELRASAPQEEVVPDPDHAD